MERECCIGPHIHQHVSHEKSKIATNLSGKFFSLAASVKVCTGHVSSYLRQRFLSAQPSIGRWWRDGHLLAIAEDEQEKQSGEYVALLIGL